ncbi:permease [Vallitalea pronyensis]|uniref:Permease n=1 Tax=Vallitalea pronyensis TaxID=1348613 RepID=A0A8J8SHT8_9FIRM|nr:permease [Vallitalea pronyensis]QUI23906.1 permease [Vallitalea pronyensis]
MLESFSVIFISIIFEAMPFVFLGTLVSSLIEVYVSSEWLVGKIGKKQLRFYILAGLIGFIMPVCECAIVPIMRRLVKKGVPLSIAITFMLATPIVNPVVLLSTYYAFAGDWIFVVGRGLLGYIGAVTIGIIVERLSGKEAVLKDKEVTSCGCGHDHHHDHHHTSHKSKLQHVLNHLGTEFIDVSKYLIVGAFIASCMQVVVPRHMITQISNNTFASIGIMMLLAFVLSLCSEADAFIAATFRKVFPNSAIIAFLIYGPMIDIKNTMMLLSSFKTKFVIKLIATITVICFILGMLSLLFM